MATVRKYKGGMTHADYSRQYKHKNQEQTMISYAKDRAKRKGFEFNIEKSDIDIPIICPILGIPIFKEMNLNRLSGPSGNSPSLDRIDNAKGYIKGNIQVISHRANTMKANASPQELIRFANWVIYKYGGQHEKDRTK
jgi:hypothetical protein